MPILVLVFTICNNPYFREWCTSNGGSQISLLATTAACSLIAASVSKVRWKTIETAIVVPTLSCFGIVYPVDHRFHFRKLMIAGWYHTILRAPSWFILPSFGFYLCYLCNCICNDRQFVDYHCHHIGIVLGIGRVTGIRRGMDCRAIISGAFTLEIRFSPFRILRC